MVGGWQAGNNFKGKWETVMEGQGRLDLMKLCANILYMCLSIKQAIYEDLFIYLQNILKLIHLNV